MACMGRNHASPGVLVGILLLSLTVLLPACGGGGGGGSDGNSSDSAAPPTDPGESSTPLPAPAASQTENYAIYYGELTQVARRNLETYALAIVHPTAANARAMKNGDPGPQREDIADIQDGIDDISGTDDDVTVYCYVDAGEDDRTQGLTDAQLLQDPRFTGDASGPRVDPRTDAPFPDGAPLLDIDPKGKASPGGTGFASWYLDDDDWANGHADGAPDRVGDSSTGIAYANFGDPNWFSALNNFTLKRDNIAGLQELLSTDETTANGDKIRGFGCDGVLLDVVDPAAPNDFTDESSTLGGGETEFEWIAPGLRDFITRIKDEYPNAKVMQNRGLFFFKPDLNTFSVNPGDVLDAMLLEDYRLDEDTEHLYPPVFYADDRYNTLPKLSAESKRPDGFPIYSLDYAMGPADKISLQTLRDGSDLGRDELLEDIRQAEDIAGFNHYFSDTAVTYLNDFVRNYDTKGDEEAPKWSSTYNDGPQPPDMATAPEPRVGIQQVVPGNNSVLVRWDVALDKSPVDYTLYYSRQPFEFDSYPDLSNATVVKLTPELPQAYEAVGTGPARYPYEARVEGLTSTQPYHFVIRATDTAGNEEKNRTVMTATPYSENKTTISIDGSFDDWANVPVLLTDANDAANSAGPDWRQIQITNDDQNLYIRFTSANPFNLDGSPDYGFSRLRIYIDADQDFRSGYYSPEDIGALGSDLLISGDALYRQGRGDDNTYISDLAVMPVSAVTDAEIAVPLAEIRNVIPGAARLNFLFQNDEVDDYAPDGALDGNFLEYTLIP